MTGVTSKMMGTSRHTEILTGGWRFAPHHGPAQAMPADAAEVTVPHTVVELPWHAFDDADYQMLSAYTRTLDLRGRSASTRSFVRFEGVMTAATVRVDDRVLARHLGGYTPFEVEVTDLGDTPTIRIDVDSHHRADIPPFGGRVGFLTFGGIYREVRLEHRPACHLVEPFVSSRPTDDTGTATSGDGRRDIEVAARLDGFSVLPSGATFRVEVLDGAEVVAMTDASIDGEHLTATLPAVAGLTRWDIDDPRRYDVRLSVRDADGELLDELTVTTGFRDAAFTSEGFFLNGRRVQLRGLNRHQTYPYVGGAVPRRLQERDAHVLRYDLGCNVVRSSHYPPDSHFLDACDRLGLLVFDEIPGWQHIGDDDWKQVVLHDVQAMVLRDRNHPSVIIWGTRINESLDDHDLYAATAARARELDPTRPTGGVRYFPESELLEDVFTYNDFYWPMLDPVGPTQLNTEFAGHTYPTRQGDPTDRHEEHVRRHARVHDHLGSHPTYSGGIGWVAFDYHQGPELNVADRIDAHGVGDVFRHPKPAAAFYASQIDPAERVVLDIVGSWARGDSAEPTGRTDPQVLEKLVCTNCDHVEAFVDDDLVATIHPDRQTYPHLPHPPMRLPLGTERFVPSTLRLVGYLDDEVVAERHYAGDGVDRDLVAWAEHGELHADGNDLTQLSFLVTDRFGNRRRAATGVVTVTVKGPVSIVGENPFGLHAGGGAVLIRAGTTPGTATITVDHPRLGSRQVTVEVGADER